MSEFRNRHVTNIGDELNGYKLDRRQLIKRAAIVGAALPTVAGLLAACDDDDADDGDVAAETDDDDVDTDDTSDDVSEDPDDSDDTDDEPDELTDDDDRYGGSINIVITGELPTFDTQTVTQAFVGHVTWHMFEHLFTWDEDMMVVPELADTHEVTDDGLLHTLTIREGVLFHDGEVMTSDDVIASIERWDEVAGAGVMDVTDDLVQVDDHTIEFHLNERLGLFSTIFARQNRGCTIHPQWVMEEAGTSIIDDEDMYIGTGTYKFVEHLRDRHIRLERFEDYVSRDEPASGYAGRKYQYLDELYFIPAADDAAAVQGLRAGDYHYKDSLHYDNRESLEADPNVTVQVPPSMGWSFITFNFVEGILSGLDNQGHLLRQAINTALDKEAMMIATHGEGAYNLHPSISFEGLPWRSEAGGEYYNQNDPDRAMELMEEAGYDGEPIIWMSTRDSDPHYNGAITATQQLEDIGFNIELELYDWATVGERREDPSVWQAVTGAHSFRPDPSTLTPLRGPDHYGQWNSEGMIELTAQLQREHDFDVRFELFEELQELWYWEVPRIKIGDYHTIHAHSSRLHGWTPTIGLQVAHWNQWLED